MTSEKILITSRWGSFKVNFTNIDFKLTNKKTYIINSARALILECYGLGLNKVIPHNYLMSIIDDKYEKNMEIKCSDIDYDLKKIPWQNAVLESA